MKTFILFTACLAFANALEIGIPPNLLNSTLDFNRTLDEEEGKIINGNFAQMFQFPWQVGIFHILNGNNRQFCGGALISDEWILTAGHCVYNATDFEVILGATKAYDQQNGKIVMGVSIAVYHPQYNPNTLNNDVALVKLVSPVNLNNQINTIRLANSNSYLQGGVTVYVSGWGKTSDQEDVITNDLRWVQLTTITNPQCRQFFIAQLVQDNVVCCDGSQIKSTCNGDSGGPLIVIDSDGFPTHVGVVSFVSTNGCAKGYPSGFARTASFISYINFITGLNLA